MIINISIKENKDAPEWASDKLVAKSDFPNIEVACGIDEKEQCINEVKGIVLCAIGQWNKVPDNISFVVNEI